MTSIAFICTANRCRSVIADAILVAEVKLRGLSIEVYSGGVYDFRGAPAIDDTSNTCAFHQTPAPSNIANWVRDLPLDSITRFLVMEQFHADILMDTYAIPADRISLLGEFDPKRRGAEIADPYARGMAVYEECYGIIQDCIRAYLEQYYPTANN